MRIQGKLAPGFWLVFWRELGWLRRRPFLLALTTLVPLLLSALLTAVFSTGLATRLPIGVLDLDSSELSRSVIRLVDATPDTAVAVRVAELAEGRNMILSGRILGLLMLPVNLERDVLAGRRPEVVFFYNTQMMTPGNLVLRGVNAAVPSAAAGVRLSLRTAQGQPIEAAQAALAPIPVQTNALFNPTLNYVHFLLAVVALLIARAKMLKPPFPELSAELKKDRQWLKNQFRSARKMGSCRLRISRWRWQPTSPRFLPLWHG